MKGLRRVTAAFAVAVVFVQVVSISSFAFPVSYAEEASQENVAENSIIDAAPSEVDATQGTSAPAEASSDEAPTPSVEESDPSTAEEAVTDTIIEDVVESAPSDEVVVVDAENTEEDAPAEATVGGGESSSESALPDPGTDDLSAPSQPAAAPLTSADAPQITTDKEDYTPGEDVHIVGRFFAALQDIVLRIFGYSHDGSDLKDESRNLQTEEDGSFSTIFTLDDVYRPVYDVVVTAFDTGIELARTTFLDAPPPDPDMDSVQLDGNIADSPVGGVDIPTDWGDLFSASGVPNALFGPFVATSWSDDQFGSDFGGSDPGSSSADITYFGQGKDIDPISSWTCVSQGNPADKEDILHSYAALSIGTSGAHTGHRILSVGLERYSSNGTASLGFWILKDGTIGCAAPSTFTGAHQDGDILLTSEFTGGGTVSSITAYQWVGSSPGALNTTPIATGADCATTTNANLCARVNSASIPTPWPTHPKSGANNNLPANQFFEAAVDLDAILPGANQCFTGILGTTRSSAGTTADIKDYARLNLNTCGTLNIVKDAIPNDAQDFAFTATGGLTPSSFSLDDDADGTLPNTKTFTNVAPGSYGVSEAAVSGWDQTSAVCSDSSLVNNISIQAGETVTCTFTNTQQKAHLTLLKDVVNDNGGTAVDTDWTLSASGQTPISGVEGNAAVTDAAVNAGVYTLGESGGPAGYTASTYSCVKNGGQPVVSNSITLAAGDNATCTITNNDIAPILHLRKVVVNDNGGSALNTAWTLHADGAGANDLSGSTPVDSGAGLLADTWALSETGGPSGYTASAWVCVGGQQNGANITVGIGQEATCTITNNDIAPKLILEKTVVNNNGGTATEADFQAKIDGDNVAWDAENAVSVGQHTASEVAGPGGAGYVAGTWGGDCAANGTVTLAPGETKTCAITNDDIAPTLTLVKTVVNNNGGNATTTDFQAKIDGNDVPWGVAQQLNVGAHTASEVELAGYTASGWGGNCAANGTVTLAPGENKTCTITNDDQQAFIIVDKTVINDNGGTAVANDFLLTVDGNAVSDGVAYAVSPGAHTAGETLLAGYTAGAWGGGCNAQGNVSVALGETKTCTITNNDQQAYITVVKVVTNDDGGSAVPNDFNLTLEGNPVSSGVAVPVNPGTYTAGETLLSGYTFEGFTGDCDSNGDVTVALGESKTCTLTNNDQQAYVKVIKVVTNDNGGSAQPDDFDLTLEGNAVLSGALTPVNPGTYTAGETNLPGYTFEGFSGDCDVNGDVTVALGQTKTCTLTNNDQQAYITVVKVVNNDNGGTAGPNDFALKLEGNAVSSGVAVPVNPGTYTASETLVTGYAFDGFSGDCDVNGDVTVALGQSKTCTLTNSDIQPKLTLVKHVVNNYGGTKQVSDFPLFVDATGVTSGVANGFNAGSYTASETNQTGYTASDWGGDCATDGSVTLDIGDDKTCEITNSDIQPKLIVIKHVVNDNGGTAVASNFTMNVSGNNVSSSSFPGVEAPGTEVTLNAGGYGVNENGIGGYTASFSTDCNGDIAVGQTKTCTITNNDQPGELIVKKVVVNDNGGTLEADDFSFQVNGGSVEPFEVDGQNNKTVNAGTYDVTEPAVPGYATSYENCEDMVVPNGGSQTCTITNDDIAPKLTLVKIVVNGDGGDAVEADWLLDAAGPTPINGNGGVVSGASFDAGEYDLTESSAVTGYEASDWVCVGGNQTDPNTVQIGLGDDVTCTITNDDVAPKLTLVKFVTNDDGGNAMVADFPLFVSGNGVTSGVANTLLANTLYTATETNLEGYTPSVWGGDCAADGTITLNEGDDKTCTITNDDVAPTLKLVKQVMNDDGGDAVSDDWTLSADAGVPDDARNFSNLGGSGVFETIYANVGYDLSESNITGYTPGDWSCDGGSLVGGIITLNEGEDITCTITNDDIAPTLKLVKVVTNDHGGEAVTDDWTLSANADAPNDARNFSTLGGSGVFETIFANTAYNLSESDIFGYEDGDWNCIGGSLVNGAVTLNEGETATCTIVNDDIQPKLTVYKQVINDNGGLLESHDFSIAVDGSSTTPHAFQGSATGTLVMLNAGAYDVSELELFGYAASYSADCTGSIAVGEEKTCTITNDDIAPELTVIKHVVNDNGGTAVAGDWTMDVTATNPSDASFPGAENPGTTITLDQGNYSVDESGGPAGYAKTLGANCSGTITVGEKKTCTITNDDIQPKLKLVKNVVNDNGGTAVADDFQGSVSGTDVDWNVFVGFNAGNYDANETVVNGYAASDWGGDCAADGSITLSVGQEKTCTITNDDIAPRLTVIKHVVNDNGDNATASDFTMNVTGTDVSDPSFPGAEAPGTTVTLDAGNYSVDESPNANYTKTIGANCSGTIAIGEEKTCTITNNDIPHATRTQGFWQTHTAYTTSIFNQVVGGWSIGTTPKAIDTTNKLFAGFYSSIPKKSTGAQRTALDKARMQMLQQWLAAKLNCQAFGCNGPAQTLLANAATAWAGTNTSLILSYASQLDAYNNSEDDMSIPGPTGKATPKTSQAGAAYSFWDLLP
jgi:hypothetical protein